ncbi:MAG: STAS domain-containing protein [bacterium]
MDIKDKYRFAVIKLNRELTISESPELKEKVRECIERGYNKVLLDFTDVDFVDSDGVGAVISARKALRGRSGDLRIFGLTASVEEVFKITQLDRVIGVFDSEAEAAGNFMGPAA